MRQPPIRLPIDRFRTAQPIYFFCTYRDACVWAMLLGVAELVTNVSVLELMCHGETEMHMQILYAVSLFVLHMHDNVVRPVEPPRLSTPDCDRCTRIKTSCPLNWCIMRIPTRGTRAPNLGRLGSRYLPSLVHTSGKPA